MSHPARRILMLALAAFPLLTAACASRPEPGDATSRTEDGYHLVFLRSGPAELAEAEQQTAMVGHFTNMERMAEAGQLLLAGPFSEPRVDPGLRGLFVLNTSDAALAARWAGSDPAVLAGALTAEVHAFSSSAPLRRLPELERKDARRRTAADPEEPWEGRGYVLAIARGGALDPAALPAALVAGRLDDPDAGPLLLILDVDGVEGARAVLGGRDDGVELHPWYGTRMLEQL